MKGKKLTNPDAFIDDAFAKINLAVGTELTDIVNTIETYEKEQTKKHNMPAKVVNLVRIKAKRLLAFAK